MAMAPFSIRGILIVYPSSTYLSISFVLGLLALRTTTSLASIILLLAMMRLYVLTVYSRSWLLPKLGLSVVVLAVAATVANANSSLDATPDGHAATLFSLFLLSAFESIIIVAALFIEARLLRRPGGSLFIFPAVWSLILFLASTFSPLGYLGTWNPTAGVEAYTWLRPVAGPPSIDFVAGTWAVVLSEFMGAWIMGGQPDSDAYAAETEDRPRDLIDSSNGPQSPTGKRSKKKSSSPFVVALVLLILALPSFFRDTLPIPVFGDDVESLSVACAMPSRSSLSRHHLAFEDMLDATKRLVSRAKIILWPEAAVKFDSEVEKEQAIQKLRTSVARSLIGVSFIETYGPRVRNGIMLVDRAGVQFEYYKRHLVPFTESYSMSAGSKAPDVFTYELPIGRNSRNKPAETLNVTVTASICLDFAHPRIFRDLPVRPTLILGPAHTWERGIAESMWQQASSRAEEIHSTLLWCDGGEQGLSGVIGESVPAGDVVQVGAGSWVRNIGLKNELDTSKTIYHKIGPWLWVVMVCGLIGIELSVLASITQLMKVGSRGRFFGGVQIHGREVWRSLREWHWGRRQQQQLVVDEETSLLQ